MKLLQSINRRYIYISFAILISGGIVFYFILRDILDNQLTDQLYQDKLFFTGQYQNKILPDSSYDFPGIKIEPAQSVFPDRIKDTIELNPIENEYEPHRELTFSLSTQNDIYSVTVSKTLYERDDLVRTIAFTLLGIILIQFILLQSISGYLNKRLFKPLFATIRTMNNYSAGKTVDISLEETNISEFSQLNTSFENMHKRVITDYNALKEFTENASHELQTPLAVLQSKIELMQPDENLDSKQLFALEEMSNHVLRLSKMNKTLLLMAKIGNNQFAEIQPVNLSEMLENKLSDLRELIDFKKINVHFDAAPGIFVPIHPALADILLNNLVSNAIKHNKSGGDLVIQLTRDSLMIKNTGADRALPEEKIFRRFYRGSSSADSSGLGLALVKQICDNCRFTVKYRFDSPYHIFTIFFNPGQSN